MSEWHGHGGGKIILLGEHSVVYGRPALAAGLTHGARARIEPADNDGYLEVHPWRVRVHLGRQETDVDREQLRQAFATVCARAQLEHPVGVHAEVTLPAGAGLGSSAALGVAVVRALDHAAGRTRDAADVAEACMPWECVFHGNPSGVDSAMAAAGGIAIYRRGSGIEPLTVPRALHIVIGYSGSPGSTKETVAHVAKLHAEDSPRIEGCFDTIAALVTAAQSRLGAGDLPGLGALLNRNHAQLVALGLSTPALDRMCEAALGAGALGAKLTGGGGGGCMIALVASREAAEPVIAALSSLDYESFATEIAPTEIA